MSENLAAGHLGDADREVFAFWLEQLQQRWIDARKPQDLLMPTLKTKIAQRNRFDPSRVLQGRFLESTETRLSENRNVKLSCSIIETACGLSLENELDVSMARVLAYMSPDFAVEGQSIAFQAFDFANKNSSTQSTSASGAAFLYEQLKLFLQKESILFLAHFCYWSSRQDVCRCSDQKLINFDTLGLSDFWLSVLNTAAIDDEDSLDSKNLTSMPAEEKHRTNNNKNSDVSTEDNKTEMTQVDAYCMVLPLYWIDFTKFGRVKSNLTYAIQDEVREYNKASKNAVYTLPQSERLLDKFRQRARDIQYFLGIKSTRQVDETGARSLLRHLESEHGLEGAKRFAQQSYEAFLASEEIDDAIFWSCFRTFIDLDFAISIGKPFRVFHSWKNIVISSTDKDASVQHSCGASISLTNFYSTFRSIPQGL